jgi:hypothetical protein
MNCCLFLGEVLYPLKKMCTLPLLANFALIHDVKAAVAQCEKCYLRAQSDVLLAPTDRPFCLCHQPDSLFALADRGGHVGHSHSRDGHGFGQRGGDSRKDRELVSTHATLGSKQTAPKILV